MPTGFLVFRAAREPAKLAPGASPALSKEDYRREIGLSMTLRW
jgi:hypothetical protein